MEQYEQNLTGLRDTLDGLRKKDKRISIMRLLCLTSTFVLFYHYYQHDALVWLFASFLSAIAFGLLLKYHDKLRWAIAFKKAQIEVNEDEIAFLKGDASNFDNGESFTQHNHPYSYDLDFFGDNSLYQYLNRTKTTSGKEALANGLLKIKRKDEVVKTQQSIKELSGNLQWRLTFTSLANMNPDSSESLDELREWCAKKPKKFPPIAKAFMFILPFATIISILFNLASSYESLGTLSFMLFVINLGVFGAYGMSIKNELINTTKIEKILKGYSLMLKEIESSDFQSEKLIELKGRLLTGNHKSSHAIHQLALHFGRLEHVTNMFASPILNGLLLYHIHVLKDLSKWREQHAHEITNWLKTIGELEYLNSLANYSYNNPEFIFPDLNENYEITFTDLGHPLLKKETAVTNSIDFSNHRFFILTGSNMSGKSTFLRTIGTNMVLAGIGAPIFASNANIHPLPVHVSMRLTDSLTDSESYFYAEVKRLKNIMKELDNEPTFILLDEILRGTNSDDKRDGTIEVIRKIALQNALGGIASHDLEVCKTVEEYPSKLTNKRFEVEIINDELHFDYKLKEGVCQNKSASFIMKKMGVI